MLLPRLVQPQSQLFFTEDGTYITPMSGMSSFDVNITVPIGFDDLSAAIVMDASEYCCQHLACQPDCRSPESLARCRCCSEPAY